MSTGAVCTKFVLLLPRSMLTCAWSPFNSRCGPETVTATPDGPGAGGPLPDAEGTVGTIGPVIGVHTGPRVMGIAWIDRQE